MTEQRTQSNAGNLAWAFACMACFVIGVMASERPRAVRPSADGYGGGIPAFATPSDQTPAAMGFVGCDVSGGGNVTNIFLSPVGLHGASLIVTGQCDTEHGPHPVVGPKATIATNALDQIIDQSGEGRADGSIVNWPARADHSCNTADMPK